MSNEQSVQGRILIVDDNPSVHEDIRKVLAPSSDLENKKLELDRIGSVFFGEDEPEPPSEFLRPVYDLVSAFQGKEGFQRVKESLETNNQFDMAFIDMRMPPGWDGVETISKIWEVDPDLHVVVCTAFSDYTWTEIIEQLGSNDRLLILKKPFDNIEVSQLASAMIQKRRLMTQMESVVEERTRELQSALEHANQAAVTKSQFLANMSHDIRTPLTSIIGYADTYFTGTVADNLTEEQRTAIEVIIRSGKHLAELINEILDLSKIERGKMVIKLQTCSSVEISKDIVDTLQIQAQRKEIALRLKIPKGFQDFMEVDPVRLRQILVNLVGNAVKFTSDGSVELRLSEVEIDGVPHVRFEIDDTGIGISESQLAKIYEPFTQADGSMTRDYQGTGLGLTISKRFAQLLGGDLHCESQLHLGSTFTCDIPIGNPDPSKWLASPPASGTVDQDDLSAYKILLAEDDKVNRHFASVMLSRAGANVTAVENGQRVCEEVVQAQSSEHPFDVVLMDMQMPVMDGYTAATKLRDDGFTIPIIALTAHAKDGDREKCLNAGCDDYTTKPIKRKELFGLIHQLALSHAQSASSAASP